jgi:steroid 5-alpha reductase family enzyme
MFDLNAYVLGLAPMAAIALLAWGVSVAKRDVSIVDSVWAGFFLAGAAVYAATVPTAGPRTALIMVLVTLWALRLSGYITWRGWGEPEDHRYRAIRNRNEPNFALKSLYLIFALQAVLAWIVSLPLLAAIGSPAQLHPFDYVGAALWLFGFLFEAIGDYQLARFKANPANRGRVMDRGLWRYTRHPNYFGEFCLWWGFYLIAAAGGGWWAIASPLLVSFLLLKVSGVTMLEKDIGERRPNYRDYIARTPAFFPGPAKRVRTAQGVR